MVGRGQAGPLDLLAVSGPHRLSLAALLLPIDEEGRLRWTSGFSGSNGQVGERGEGREEQEEQVKEEGGAGGGRG